MRRLVSIIISILCVGSIFAAGTGTLYDELFGRPTYFPDFTPPNTWPNNMTLYVKAVDNSGNKIVNYEVAVYDQNDCLRTTGRSIASQQDLCPLTILGTEGDEFRFEVIYGNFGKPDIHQCQQTIAFKTNYSVSPGNPIELTPVRNSVSGDMDDDGIVTVNDIRILSQSLLSGADIKDNPKLPDMNNDGRFSISDITLVIDSMK